MGQRGNNKTMYCTVTTIQTAQLYVIDNVHIPPKVSTSLHFTSFYFTSLHFTSLPVFHLPPLLDIISSRCKSLRVTSLHFSSLIITFLTFSLKICDLQGKVSSAFAGSRFHSLINYRCTEWTT